VCSGACKVAVREGVVERSAVCAGVDERVRKAAQVVPFGVGEIGRDKISAEMMLRYGITIRAVMTIMCFVHTSNVTRQT